MDVKKCPYCGNELGKGKHTRTQEHIIPKSLIDLYPEQDITFDRNIKNGMVVDNKGITIGDVCKECNEGVLSTLDLYGKTLITKKFYYPPYEFDDYYRTFQIELDTSMFMRWILKIFYNEIRKEKRSSENIKKLIPFIMDGNGNKSGVSFFLGLHINLNPIPEELFGVRPLQINMEPQFFKEAFQKGTKPVRFNIPQMDQACAIRFGNCVVYVVLWKDNAEKKVIEEVSNTLETEFRFRKLDSECNLYSVRSVSAPSNAILGNYSHFLSEMAALKMIEEIKQSLHGRNISECKQQFESEWDENMTKMGRALIEKSMFPNNKKKQRIYEKYYGDKKNDNL